MIKVKLEILNVANNKYYTTIKIFNNKDHMNNYVDVLAKNNKKIVSIEHLQ